MYTIQQYQFICSQKLATTILVMNESIIFQKRSRLDLLFGGNNHQEKYFIFQLNCLDLKCSLAQLCNCAIAEATCTARMVKSVLNLVVSLKKMSIILEFLPRETELKCMDGNSMVLLTVLQRERGLLTEVINLGSDTFNNPIFHFITKIRHNF